MKKYALFTLSFSLYLCWIFLGLSLDPDKLVLADFAVAGICLELSLLLAGHLLRAVILEDRIEEKRIRKSRKKKSPKKHPKKVTKEAETTLSKRDKMLLEGALLVLAGIFVMEFLKEK